MQDCALYSNRFCESLKELWEIMTASANCLCVHVRTWFVWGQTWQNVNLLFCWNPTLFRQIKHFLNTKRVKVKSPNVQQAVFELTDRWLFLLFPAAVIHRPFSSSRLSYKINLCRVNSLQHNTKLTTERKKQTRDAPVSQSQTTAAY